MFITLTRVWTIGSEEMKTKSSIININKINYMERTKLMDEILTEIRFDDDYILVLESVDHIMQMIEDLNLTK